MGGLEGFGEAGGGLVGTRAGAEKKGFFEDADLGGGEAKPLPIGGERRAAGGVEGLSLDIEHEGGGALEEGLARYAGPGLG